jgi:hypothetical protein
MKGHMPSGIGVPLDVQIAVWVLLYDHCWICGHCTACQMVREWSTLNGKQLAVIRQAMQQEKEGKRITAGAVKRLRRRGVLKA